MYEISKILSGINQKLDEYGEVLSRISPQEKWLTDQEAADELGVGLNSFRSNNKPYIPHSKRGRKCMRLSDLNAYRMKYFKQG